MKLQYRTQDGLTATAEVESNDGGNTFVPAGSAVESFAGRNFVTQLKNGGIQVLAETNTPTKATRIAEALNAGSDSDY